MLRPERRALVLALAPTLGVLGLLFGGGIAQALASSLEGGGVAWRTVLASPTLLPALGFTLWVAILSTALSGLIGLAAALLLRRAAHTAFGGRARALVQVPLPVPHLVAAIGMLMLLGQSGLLARLLVPLGFGEGALPDLVNDRYGLGIALTYVWKEAPFVAVLLLSALRGETRAHEEAARNLGAKNLRVFGTITLPALAPALGAASLLIFAYTFGAFEVPRLLGRTHPEMLSVWAWRLYTDVDLGARPRAMVVALLITAGVLAFVAVGGGVRLLWRRGTGAHP